MTNLPWCRKVVLRNDLEARAQQGEMEGLGAVGRIQ
jgi:hypothetical protein